MSWAAPFDPWRQRHFQTKKSWLSVFRCYFIALDLNTCSFHVIGPFLLCICGHKLFNYRLIVCHQCQPVRKHSALPQEEVTPGEATALTSRSTEEQKQEPCVRLPGQPGVHLSGVLPVGQALSICCGPIGHRVCGVFKEVRQWIKTSSLKVVWLLCGTNIEMIVNFWADAGGWKISNLFLVCLFQSLWTLEEWNITEISPSALWTFNRCSCESRQLLGTDKKTWVNNSDISSEIFTLTNGLWGSKSPQSVCADLTLNCVSYSERASTALLSMNDQPVVLSVKLN